MNLTEMGLNQLVFLWQTGDKNPMLIGQIEGELRKRIQNNTNFSREYFLQVCKIKNHAITVSFIPSSESFKIYGPNLTLDIILSEDEMGELLKNYTSNPVVNSSGILRAKILVKDNLTDEQIKLAADKGFNTKDVFETLSI